MTTLNLLAVLVIANPQQDVFAKPKCEPATSHTCGVVEAICLLADGHTTFAMTTLNLPTNLVIAMERSDRSNPIANRSPHCVRHDNPYYVRDDNLFLNGRTD
jgi:hypothetical protein